MSGFVKKRAARRMMGSRNNGRSSQPGVPININGGATSVSSKCCVMCTLNR